MSLVSYYEKKDYDHVVSSLEAWSNEFLARSPLAQKIYGKHPTKLPKDSKDAEGFPLEKNRLCAGQRPFSPQDTFSSTQEYLAAIWLGAKIAQETEEKDQESIFDANLHIVRLEDNELMCFFDVPDVMKEAMKKNPKARLEEGDHMEACFDHDKEKEDSKSGDEEGNHDQERKVYYDLRIIEPLPFSKTGSLTAVMTRLRCTSVDGEERLPDPPMTSLKSMSKISNMEKMNHIMTAEAAEARIKTVWRHSEFVYVFQAAKILKQDFQDIESKLYDVDSLYGTGSLDHLNYLYDVELNESQRNALEMGRHALGGFLVAHGGPRTGKTHFVTELIKPFFLDDEHHQILPTAAGNRGADNMARILHGVLEGISPTRNGIYVVRMHSVKTEIRIFLSDAKSSRRKNEAAKRSSKMPTAADDQAGNVNDAIATHFQAYAMGKYEATHDDRLQEIELSVGTRMRKNLSDASTSLRHLYTRYANGDNLAPIEHVQLWKEAIKFLRWTITGSTAVCCTVAGAFDHDVHESFSGAEMIIVDEAARVMEYQLWPLFAFYRRAKGKIMVGDPYQLGPTGPQKEDRNPFSRQMELSLQARLQSQSFPTAFFNVQYRVVPEIATIFNETCYGSRLESDVTTGVESRPLPQAIRQHNKLHYGVNHSVVFFDIKGAKEALYRGKPKYCDEYITTVSEIVEDLLMAGFGQRKRPCTIAILTTYKLEQKRLKYTWMKMLQSELFDENATVVVETVDKAQGMEYDIVVIDPVAVKSAGFLTSNRLNVLFSRARNGLYVVGDKSQWRKMFDNVNFTGSQGAVELKALPPHCGQTAATLSSGRRRNGWEVAGRCTTTLKSFKRAGERYAGFC